MSLQMAEMVPAQRLSTSDLVTTRRKTRRYPPIFNISEVTLWRWVKRGYFPEPRYIGGKAFWSLQEVMEFIDTSPTRRVSA